MTKVSLHRFANLPRRFLMGLGLGVGIWAVGAIAPSPDLIETAHASQLVMLEKQFTAFPEALLATESVWEAAIDNLPNLISVTFYTPTISCEDYEGTKKAIAKAEAVPQVVDLLLSQQVPELISFELAGYRVQQDAENKRVTIDFRRRSGARRQFISLSICEQRVLFGSLRRTLLDNPVLEIESVRFTEQGNPIEL